MLSVTFINQLMHSVITVIDVKILLYKSLIYTHLDLYLTILTSTTVITECISWLINVTDNIDARWKSGINLQ